MRLADSGRLTQAMKREGIWFGEISSEGVAVPDSGGCAEWLLGSEREEKIPERMDTPSVPLIRWVSELVVIQSAHNFFDAAALTYRIPAQSKCPLQTYGLGYQP